MSAQGILKQRIVSMTTLDVSTGNTTAGNCKYETLDVSAGKTTAENCKYDNS